MNDLERQQLKDEIVEQLLLALPEVIGNLITNHISMLKRNKEFYQKYPEFRDKKDIVASVIEMVEGQNINANYDTILEKAVPEIRARLNLTDKLDITDVHKPTLGELKFDNGVL